MPPAKKPLSTWPPTTYQSLENRFGILNLLEETFPVRKSKDDEVNESFPDTPLSWTGVDDEPL